MSRLPSFAGIGGLFVLALVSSSVLLHLTKESHSFPKASFRVSHTMFLPIRKKAEENPRELSTSYTIKQHFISVYLAFWMLMISFCWATPVKSKGEYPCLKPHLFDR